MLDAGVVQDVDDLAKLVAAAPAGTVRVERVVRELDFAGVPLPSIRTVIYQVVNWAK